ncbi:hypothetical protein GQ43DRAFT_15324 [Delitschia confertaspora ATCC 74209]|uniref:Myb-like DNA-binding domain protein n=1 Tax=Delitschia confertaspora ATCC 74209 TaxID=1513339 RepID=A0A9P4MWR6_9PLEO|nr:hypothetical protein GQ43DRAFT_15324 [Delitschia confertaspora ATCC 74209]
MIPSAYSTPGPTSSASLTAGSMQGGPVLPGLSELQRLPEHMQQQPPQAFRPLYTGPPSSTTSHLVPGPNGSPPSQQIKRAASQTPLPEESPAGKENKQKKWGPEDDNIMVELRGQGMKWDDVAKRFPGRSSIACRLRYQNYLEKRAHWDEEKKNKLARLYARFKEQMWTKISNEMQIPWRAAESMHWQLGEQDMSARANAPVFQLHPSATGMSTPQQMSAVPAQTTSHGFTPANANQFVPNLQPPPPQPQPQPHQQTQGPVQTYQHRTATNPSQGRRRNSSLSRRRGENTRTRPSAPPQAEPPLQPQPLQPASDNRGLPNEAKTVPTFEAQSGLKREGESGHLAEPHQKRRREEDCMSKAYRLESDNRSQGTKSPDFSSQRSATGSIRSMKREGEDQDRVMKEPEPTTS